MDYKLIIGLGNPGKKYEKTRHNAGFMAIDFLRKKFDAPKLKLNKKFNAEIVKTESKKEKIIMAKPLTFMNNSGEAVFSILSFYKIKPKDLIVVHDDMDLDLGDLRENTGRGSAGHNGVQSIINILGTKDFLRWRIGIGRPEKSANNKTIPPDAYVLQKFNKEEIKIIKETFKKIAI